ncbi:MAG: aldo/keto reductase [Bacteroidales bacterium]|nr:aldo/keto reductase [Bacteroidales bacterium]
MQTKPRRDFLKKSLVALSGAAVLPGTLNQAFAHSRGRKVGDDLVYRILGKTGLNIPVISMGTGAASPALIKAAYDKGINLFFTATYYGEGNNEKMLGDSVKDLPRESLIIGTAAIPKGVDHRGGLFTEDSTYDGLMEAADESLKRFGMDYVDFMLLPYAGKRESVFFEPLLRAMEDIKKKGKARFIGIASHSFQAEAVKAAVDTGIYDCALVGYNFRMENITELDEAFDYAGKAGLGILNMKSQVGGFWDKERTQPINPAAALKWVLKNKNIAAAVTAISNFDELEMDLSIMKEGLEMTEDETNDLKLASAGRPGLYCLQCRQCEGQCAQDLDIPTLMQSYMYAYGYRNLEQARHTLDNARLPEQACDQCELCTVRCSAGFNVAYKIRDIARLKDVPMDFLRT